MRVGILLVLNGHWGVRGFVGHLFIDGREEHACCAPGARLVGKETWGIVLISRPLNYKVIETVRCVLGACHLFFFLEGREVMVDY